MSRKSVVRLNDRPDMTIDINRGHKTTTQQQQKLIFHLGQMENLWFLCVPVFKHCQS